MSTSMNALAPLGIALVAALVGCWSDHLDPINPLIGSHWLPLREQFEPEVAGLLPVSIRLTVPNLIPTLGSRRTSVVCGQLNGPPVRMVPGLSTVAALSLVQRWRTSSLCSQNTTVCHRQLHLGPG
jgi:hypothetical protein